MAFLLRESSRPGVPQSLLASASMRGKEKGLTCKVEHSGTRHTMEPWRTFYDFVASGLFDLVAASHRVIAFDRPGYGYSERPRDQLWTPQAQADLLRRAFLPLGIERPVVLGHSWGTMVATALALQSPAALRGLVLLSGYYFPTARVDVPIFAPPALPVIGDVLCYTVSPLIGRQSIQLGHNHAT